MRWLTLIISFFFVINPLYSETILLRVGHLVDPDQGTITDNQLLVVEEGKIKAVGGDLEVPEGAREIDLSDHWVMPGLMDAHTHLTLGIPPSPPGQSLWASFYQQQTSAARALRGLRNAQDVLQAGFTTVKEIGNAGEWADTDLRRAIDAGWFAGPTIITSGKIIAPFGGQSGGVSHELGPIWHYEYLDADSPEEIVKAIRKNIYYGAQAIKLVIDGGLHTYTVDEVKAAVEEAHRLGLRVSAHAVGNQAMRNAILGGVDSIEHGIFPEDETLALMKEKGTILVGTDFPLEHLKHHGGPIGANPEFFADAFISRLKKAWEIGVPLVFGSDTVVAMPNLSRSEMMFDYLAVWTEAGIPAAGILKAMTTDAATFLDVDRQRGFLKEGQYADLVATPANPLDDIQALREIDFVMKEGIVVRRGERGTSEGAAPPKKKELPAALSPDS